MTPETQTRDEVSPTEDTGASVPAETSGAGVPVQARRSLFADPVPWLLLGLALGLDQLTKALVISNLARGESWPDDGFFRFTHAWNTGTAFSLFQGQSDILTYVSFGAVIALYFVYRSLPAPTLWVRMAFGLLLGGAFGNLIDRLRLGHVTDFIDVGPWPIFNIADSSIVVGIVVMFFFFWTNSEQETSKKRSAAEAEGDDKEAHNSARGGQQEPG